MSNFTNMTKDELLVVLEAGPAKALVPFTSMNWAPVATKDAIRVVRKTPAGTLFRVAVSDDTVWMVAR